jgi:hypothetical protein
VSGSKGGEREPEPHEVEAHEDNYWREAYATRPYVTPGAEYETYRPAYRHGWQARGLYGELNWEGVEPQLGAQWTRARGESRLSWEEARAAARDAWERIRPGVDYRAENR